MDKEKLKEYGFQEYVRDDGIKVFAKDYNSIVDDDRIKKLLYAERIEEFDDLLYGKLVTIIIVGGSSLKYLDTKKFLERYTKLVPAEESKLEKEKQNNYILEFNNHFSKLSFEDKDEFIRELSEKSIEIRKYEINKIFEKIKDLNKQIDEQQEKLEKFVEMICR